MFFPQDVRASLLSMLSSLFLDTSLWMLSCWSCWYYLSLSPARNKVSPGCQSCFVPRRTALQVLVSTQGQDQSRKLFLNFSLSPLFIIYWRIIKRCKCSCTLYISTQENIGNLYFKLIVFSSSYCNFTKKTK